MNLGRQVLKSFAGVGAMYILSIPIGLLTNIVLARTLGSGPFGQYSFVVSILALLTLPVIAGLPQLLTREVASYAQEQRWNLYRGAVRAAHYWVLGLTLLIVFMYVGLGPIAGWIPTEGRWSLLGIAIILVPLQGLNAVRNGAMKGLGFPALAELPSQLVQPVLMLALFATAAAAGAMTTVRAFWLQIVATGVALLVGHALYVRVQPRSADARKPEFRVRAWLESLLPFTMINVMATFSAQIGIVMLGILAADASVAALRVADRAANLVPLSLAVLNMVISPQIVTSFRRGDLTRLQELSRRCAQAAFALALPVALCFLLWGRPIIGMTFGAAYVESAYAPMAILVVAQLINVGTGPVGLLLLMSGHERVALASYALALALTVTLAFALIPSYNVVGAAVAVGAGVVSLNLFSAFAVSKILRVRPGLL